MPESPIRKKIKRHIAQALLNVGKKIIVKAEKQARSQLHYRTINLADAYCAAVYYGDTLTYGADGNKAIVFANEPKMAEEKHRGYAPFGIAEGYGRDWALQFAENFKPSASFTESSSGMDSVFTLVVFNAAYYSLFLEKGINEHGVTTGRYKLISNLGSVLEHEIRAFARKSDVKIQVSSAVPIGQTFKTVHKKK
jgi:hypothetical protein